MAEEVIVINEPDEMGEYFEDGTLLNVEGKVLRVKRSGQTSFIHRWNFSNSYHKPY